MGAPEMSGGRNIQQPGGSMPLFTVTMKSNGSTNEKDRLSRAIHAASVAGGYPEDDLFQRYLSLGSWLRLAHMTVLLGLLAAAAYGVVLLN
jgi:hypothetical protein